MADEDNNFGGFQKMMMSRATQEYGKITSSGLKTNNTGADYYNNNRSISMPVRFS